VDNSVSDSQMSGRTSGTPKKKTRSKRSTPTANGTTGFGARRGTDVPENTPSVVAGSTAIEERPAFRLQRVRTHSEAQKSMSAENRQQQQLKLFCTYGIRIEIIIINIGSLYPLVREGLGELGPYQVRPVQKYFLEQLRKRMEATGVSQTIVPFVLLVDPKLCPTRDNFQMDKKDKYKYYVIGGNHSACAWMDLSRANPHLDSLCRIQAWIVAGVTV
jgi:hypothetical protein